MSQNSAAKAIYRKDYRVPPFLVKHLDLQFSIEDGKTTVASKIDFYKNPGSAEGNDMLLDGENLNLVSVSLDGRLLDREAYRLDEHSLLLPDAPDNGILEILVDISPESNTALEGLYLSEPIYCTQCESHGFRRITYFFDRPDVMTSYTVRIEADKERCPVLLSNGNRLEYGDLASGRHYALWNDPFRKPSYLFALVAGALDHIHDTYETKSGRKVDLYIYTERGFTDQCHWAMHSLKSAMRWDEINYGREYDLDLFNIVAVSSFNMGAMENKSLNIFNTSTVYASTKTAVDASFMRVESVVAHEYFHNWTGNRITCRDWFQLTLKEGLTVFRDQCFSGDMHSQHVQRIEDVATLRTAQFPEDAGPMAHPIRPESYIAMDNFYTATVYEKGAEVIRMMRTLLGNMNYRRATDLYFERFDGQAVTCDDFVQCMQDASGIDMMQFMLWYSQAGTPTVRVSGYYDAARREFTLCLAQQFPAQPKNKAVLMPVVVALLASDGSPMQLNENGDLECVLHFDKDEQEFLFTGIPEMPVPSVFRNFSAPVNIENDLTDAELVFLMHHDNDGFNRYEAFHTIAKRFIVSRVQGDTASADLLAAAIRETLYDEKIDDAFRTTLVTLPEQALIEQSFTLADPLAIFDALQSVKREIALILKDDLLALYHARESIITKGKFPTAEEIAARMLKNSILGYLNDAADGTAIALAVKQYKGATNMSDRSRALAILCESDDAFREEALADFYKLFANDKLVIDRWFSLQSSANRADIFEQLKQLRKHKDFDIKNPNRARALYMPFANANLKHFHEQKGGGYALLAEAVLELDGFNPQIAARFMKPFQNFRRYAQPYSSLMRSCLERIAEAKKLSANVSEIVGKYLQQN